MKDGAPQYKNMPIQVSSIQLKVMLHSSGKRTQTKRKHQGAEFAEKAE